MNYPRAWSDSTGPVKETVEALTHIAAKELGARSSIINAVVPRLVTIELFLKGMHDGALNT